MAHIYDIIGRTYGKLPSEIARLPWSDLMICFKCVTARSDRVKDILRRGKRKKDMVFPNISLLDLADLI